MADNTQNRVLLTRQNLRLTEEMLQAIDTARVARAGNISRNTWITEAIAERLTREKKSGGKANA